MREKKKYKKSGPEKYIRMTTSNKMHVWYLMRRTGTDSKIERGEKNIIKRGEEKLNIKNYIKNYMKRYSIKNPAMIAKKYLENYEIRVEDYEELLHLCNKMQVEPHEAFLYTLYFWVLPLLDNCNNYRTFLENLFSQDNHSLNGNPCEPTIHYKLGSVPVLLHIFLYLMVFLP